MKNCFTSVAELFSINESNKQHMAVNEHLIEIASFFFCRTAVVLSLHHPKHT